MVNRRGKTGNSDRFYFGLQNHCGRWLQSWNWKMLASWKDSYDKPRYCIKNQRHHFVDKDLYSQSYVFSSIHVWMWELDHKEGWVLKNWCFWIVVLEKTFESPLDSKKIKSLNPKRNQAWVFIGRTDAKAEVQILWPLDVKSHLAGKDWGQEEKRVMEDEMVGWPFSEQTPRDSKRQGSLACCSPWDCQELHMT